MITITRVQCLFPALAEAGGFCKRVSEALWILSPVSHSADSYLQQPMAPYYEVLSRDARDIAEDIRELV